jgi:hypothetical protein
VLRLYGENCSFVVCFQGNTISVCGVSALVSLQCFRVECQIFFVKQQIKDIQGLHNVCLLKHSFHGTGFVSSMLTRDQNVKLKEETKM